MVLISFLKQAVRYAVFPHDKPSPLIVLLALIFCVSAIAGSIGVLADKGSNDRQCQEGPRIWLAIGIVTDAAHALVVTIVYILLRSRVKAWDDADVALSRVVLSHWSFAMWALVAVWTVIWIIVAYSRYPGPSCDGDVCCVTCNAISSLNVFLLASLLAALLLSVLTEWGAVPRWWRNVLSRDMRRREHQAAYQDGAPRAPSNADTDRAMAEAARQLSTKSGRSASLDARRGVSPPPPRPGGGGGVSSPPPPVTASRERLRAERDAVQSSGEGSTLPRASPATDTHFYNRDPPPAAPSATTTAAEEDRQFFSVIMGADEANRIVGGNSRSAAYAMPDSLNARAAAYRKRAAERQREATQAGYREHQAKTRAKQVTFKLSLSSDDDERHSD